MNSALAGAFKRSGTALALVTFVAMAGMTARAAEPLVSAAISADVPSLDPIYDNSPVAANVRFNLYEQLIEISKDGDVLPRLATGWEAGSDLRTWTFTIRDGVKFHNGQKLTAEDVAWTFEKILAEPKSPVRVYINKVTKVEKLDDFRVRFTLSEPYALFARQTGFIAILPKATYEVLGPERFSKEPVGSGPYKLLKWIKDDRLEFEAFAGYWGGQSAIKNVMLRPVPSETARSSALLSGDLDIVPFLPPSQVQALSSRSGIKVEVAGGFKVIYLGFNVTAGPLSDEKLRLAIDHAINRDAITKSLLRGLGTPSGQIASPSTFGFDPGIKPTSFDPTLAKKLLSESGYKGERLVFQYPRSYIFSADEIAQAIAGYLGVIGINVDLQGMDYNAFFSLWASRKLLGIHMFSNGPLLLDADSPLTSLYESGNRGYWSDPTVDALIRQQRGELEIAQRKATIRKIWEISQSKAVYSVLFNELQAVGMKSSIKWSPRPDGILRFREINKSN